MSVYSHISQLPACSSLRKESLTREINIHHAVGIDPIVDEPREGPRNRRFGGGDGYH